MTEPDDRADLERLEDPLAAGIDLSGTSAGGTGAQADHEALIRDSGLSIDAWKDCSRQVRRTGWICAR